MDWPKFPSERAALERLIPSIQAKGPPATALLAACYLWYAFHHPGRQPFYAGPGGHEPQNYLAGALSYSPIVGGETEWITSGNRLSFDEGPTKRMFEQTLQQGDGMPCVLNCLDQIQRDSPPDKVRARDQCEILSVCVDFNALEAAEVCVEHLLDTFNYMNAWRKLEHRANGVIKALWPKRNEWSALLYHFVDRLLFMKASSSNLTAYDFWTQVQATSGVSPVIWHFAGHDETEKLMQFARECNPKNIPPYWSVELVPRPD